MPKTLAQISLFIVAFILLLSHTVLAMDNPMQPPLKLQQNVNQGKQAGSSKPRWKLSSTLIASNRKVAVINDRTLNVGDHIKGALVTKIGPRSVTIKYNGQEQILTISGRTLVSSTRTSP